jgi:Ca2+-binding EF-hand superfamily protein
VVTLSLLLKGTEEDRLRWTFRLYDTNGDGYISREEMEDVAQSVRMDFCLFCLMLMI